MSYLTRIIDWLWWKTASDDDKSDRMNGYYERYMSEKWRRQNSALEKAYGPNTERV